MSGSSYMLEGQESELTKHIGHQVEVTGTVASGSGSMSGSGTSGSGSTGSGTTGSASGTSGSGTSASSGSGSSGNLSRATGSQRLHVTSVRMIASTCSGR